MITQAFILGAGLGTRLRPLTDILPKPLVPLFHKPLAEWAVEACEQIGCKRFAINTHHLPEKWQTFGGPRDISYFHESILLETGGGLKNIESWIEEGDLLIHNGDIYSSIDLQALADAHEASDNEVTLALRSTDGEKRITLGEDGQIKDVRSEVANLPGTHTFSGIYCVSKKFLNRIPSGEKISVIPAFQDCVREDKIGGIVLDEGEWMDLGDEASYLAAHRTLALEDAIHPSALVSACANLETSVIGSGASIGQRSKIRDAVIWPNAQIPDDSEIQERVITH